MVSIEDERFYEHKGVDIVSLTRSLLNNIFSDTTQGGSTIEMQISKNLLTSDDRTISRKIKDIYYASGESVEKIDILPQVEQVKEKLLSLQFIRDELEAWENK